MNISMIEPVSSHGGMNYYDYGLMNGFGMQGCKVTLYTSSELKFDISNKDNLSVRLFYQGIYSRKHKVLRAVKYLTGTLKSLRDARKSNAQVIHFQVFAITILEIIVVSLTKIFHFPLIVTVHDVHSFSKGNSKLFEKFFYTHVDKIIVHNNTSYETLRECMVENKYRNQVMEKCTVVHHGSYIGMLPEKIDKKLAKEKWNIAEDYFTFLFFGQIKGVKGLDILLIAFSNLIKTCKQKVKLVIAGKVWKDDFSIYDSIIKNNNLFGHLVLDIKYIDDVDIVYYYSAADCVVLPYKKIFQSGVLLMAQSYQVPVLVSDLPGMTEIITDGVNGFVFQSENPESLCRKMQLCIDKKYDNRVVENAYKKLQAEYSWDMIAKQQISIIETMILSRDI